MVKPKCLKAKISGTGITSHMGPKAAIENIKNVLIPCTENGSQDNHFLLDVHKKFDKDLTKENIQQTVVMLADGHRFTVSGLITRS